VPPPSPGTSDNVLKGVSVISACDAWAVGFDASGAADQTLIEHWDGSTWKVVPSPDPGSTDNFLTSVRAVSATSIWAVGEYSDGAGDKTLILHWNGTKWKRVPSPAPGAGAGARAAGQFTDARHHDQNRDHHTKRGSRTRRTGWLDARFLGGRARWDDRCEHHGGPGRADMAWAGRVDGDDHQGSAERTGQATLAASRTCQCPLKT
jgi:hypothetical protein